MDRNIRDYFSYFTENPTNIYLDSAATGLKLKAVNEKEFFFNRKIDSSSHSIHHNNGLLALRGINQTRRMVREFINGVYDDEIIFTSGATFGLNTVVAGVCEMLKENDEVCTTVLEHSSLIIPLLKAKNKYKLKLNYLELDNGGAIKIAAIKKVVTKKTKFVAFASISNTVSEQNDIKNVIAEVRKINKDAIILVDAAQSIPYFKTDVQAWDADFVCFSAHKMYGPWGLGILYGKRELLEKIEPLVIGGGSIYENSIDGYQLAKAPEKFEAGTQNMAGIYAYQEVFKFYKDFPLENLQNRLTALKKYFINQIETNQLREKYNFFGLENKGPIILIDTKEVNPHDFIQYMTKKYNIIVRSGTHCAANSKLLTKIEKPTIRISFGPYNQNKDIDVLIDALKNKEDWKLYLF